LLKIQKKNGELGNIRRAYTVVISLHYFVIRSMYHCWT